MFIKFLLSILTNDLNNVNSENENLYSFAEINVIPTILIKKINIG